MDYNRFKNFYKELQKILPDLQIKFKDQSPFMKILGKILFFNKHFMTNFVTTIGSTVYFPNQEEVEKSTNGNQLIKLAHEYQHAKDCKFLGSFIFSFLYLFPQILFPILLLFCFWHWWILFLALIVISPLPAIFRKELEYRAYKVSLFCSYEISKELNVPEDSIRKTLQIRAAYYNEQFISANYYFMWPFGLEKKLAKDIDSIMNGSAIKKNTTFKEIRTALSNSK